MSCVSQHGTSRNVTSCHDFVASRLFASRHIVSRLVMSRHVLSRHVVSRHVVSCHVTSRRVGCVMSRHVLSRHVTSRRVMSCAGPRSGGPKRVIFKGRACTESSFLGFGTGPGVGEVQNGSVLKAGIVQHGHLKALVLVTACQVMSRHATSRLVTSRHVCHVTSRHTSRRVACVAAWHVTQRHVLSCVCRVASYRVTSCLSMAPHGTSRRVASYRVMSVAWHPTACQVM